MPRRAVALATALLALALAGAPRAQPAAAPTTHEADFVIPDFHFRSGERLPRLRLHYRTLGAPARDASGAITNAVLILHERNVFRIKTRPCTPPGSVPEKHWLQ